MNKRTWKDSHTTFKRGDGHGGWNLIIHLPKAGMAFIQILVYEAVKTIKYIYDILCKSVLKGVRIN